MTHRVITVRRGAPWWVRGLGGLILVALIVKVIVIIAVLLAVVAIVAGGVWLATSRHRRPRIVVVAPGQFGPVVTTPSRSVGAWKAWGARSRPAPAPAPVSLRKSPPRGITTGR